MIRKELLEGQLVNFCSTSLACLVSASGVGITGVMARTV
ncbi:hypothetical protein MRBBS_2032 [Marinobacter sp. BSs20148]|nr:hypothetical protein MRBBS_2032 [Marinobacter sp. BSs20148]